MPQAVADKAAKNLFAYLRQHRIEPVIAASYCEYVTKVKSKEFALIVTPPHVAMQLERNYSYQPIVEGSRKAELYLVSESKAYKSLSELSNTSIHLSDISSAHSRLFIHKMEQTLPLVHHSINYVTHENLGGVALELLLSEADIAIITPALYRNLNAEVRNSLHHLSVDLDVPWALVSLQSALNNAEKQTLIQVLVTANETPAIRKELDALQAGALQPISPNTLNTLRMIDLQLPADWHCDTR
jgi:hypothetical protein